MQTYPPSTPLFDYFTDCHLYSMADITTPEAAYFRVNPVDVDAFPELAGAYGLKLDAEQATIYQTIDQFAAAIASDR